MAEKLDEFPDLNGKLSSKLAIITNQLLSAAEGGADLGIT